jgi:hypothetical protein
LGLRGTREEGEQDETGGAEKIENVMEEKNASTVLVGELEGKKFFGRTRCEDSIETYTCIKRNRMGN